MTRPIGRLLFALLVASTLAGCLLHGLQCDVIGASAQSQLPGKKVCAVFDGDCCQQGGQDFMACESQFPCGQVHEFGGCGCVDPNAQPTAALPPIFNPGSERNPAAEYERISVPATYLVPPFDFALGLPFAGFDSLHRLVFAVIPDAFQTYASTVTYSQGFQFRGFTALGPGATVGSYGVDLDENGTVDVALPVRAATFDTAYVDMDIDGQQTVVDPTVQHSEPSPGVQRFDLILPAGGDRAPLFKRSFIGFSVQVVLNAGILRNPPTPGTYSVSGNFTSVDPDTGGRSDGTGSSPITRAVAPVAFGVQSSPIALLDHFLCYKTKPSKGLICGPTATVNRGGGCTTDADCGGITAACGKNKLAKGVQATLADRFTAFANRVTDVKKPARLCTPAELDGRGRHDSVTHLQGYQVGVAKTEPKPVPVTNLTIVNALGALLVDVTAPDTLYVPAAQALDAPAGNLGANTVDDYACYKAKLRTKRCAGAPEKVCKSDLACGGDGPCLGKFPKGVQVTVTDEFTTGPKVFDVKKPTRLCAPALNGGSPIQSPKGYLMCYQVKPAAAAPKHAPVVGRIHTTGAVGRERLDTVTEDEVCIPSFELSEL